MSQELITELLLSAVHIIIVVVGGYIINYLSTKIGSEKLSQYYSMVKIVVQYVEQTIGAGKGEEKKNAAIQAIKDLFKDKLSEEQIDRLIESAVYEMNLLLKANNLK